MFGMLVYFYNPLIDYLHSTFPTSGIWSEAMFFFWSILAVVNLFGSGIRLVMKMQEQ